MHALEMSKMIQIRNVPDEVHRALKVRAAKEGTSLSQLLLREITQLAEQPTLEEIFERARRRKPPRPVAEDTVEIIRELRGR
jgi:antitoxin FitA